MEADAAVIASVCWLKASPNRPQSVARTRNSSRSLSVSKGESGDVWEKVLADNEWNIKLKVV